MSAQGDPCPDCGAELVYRYISLNEKLLLCPASECFYPFDITEDIASMCVPVVNTEGDSTDSEPPDEQLAQMTAVPGARRIKTPRRRKKRGHNWSVTPRKDGSVPPPRRPSTVGNETPSSSRPADAPAAPPAIRAAPVAAPTPAAVSAAPAAMAGGGKQKATVVAEKVATPSSPPEPTVKIKCNGKDRFVPHVEYKDFIRIERGGVAGFLGSKVLEAHGVTDGKKDEKKDLATVTKGDILERIVEMVARNHFNVAKEVIEVVGGPGDGGRDIVIRTKSKIHIIDCKAYKEGNNVSSKDVRSIMGALLSHDDNYDIGEGIVVTTSGFSEEALKAKKRFNTICMRKIKRSIALWGEADGCDDSLKDVTYRAIGQGLALAWLMPQL